MQYWEDERILLNLRSSTCRQEAFDQLYLKYFEPLSKMAAYYLNDKQAGDDVVQEVFIRFYEKGLARHVESSLWGYLSLLCRNGCLNVLKAQKNEKSRRKNYEAIADVYDLSYILENFEVREVVDEIGRKLTPQQKLVFEGVSIQGKRYREVAQELSVSTNTVKYHLRLALKLAEDFLIRHF
ncbi:sigma-70 family RNA polymerase sigma factor [Olivibacter domesticus]|uniref:RNA polymerase sigma-70 factor, ECF subfamily n=1 Tax=Olivibacter domesticus TaxID=407022 RepID=A0A1H7IHW1_OLID1|nr:sigma-70 family RNA polymerase sigma factor [Olivibacter domesticus]SEK61347.1 RNA polymerase sigma-70 factor, ECF subfamily [Olivibacter domesticus]